MTVSYFPGAPFAPGGVSINKDEAEYINRFYRKDIIGGIRSAIFPRLLGPGLKIESNLIDSDGNPIPASEDLEYLVISHWLEFTREALDSLICFGYVIFTTEVVKIPRADPGRKRNALVPRVVPHGRYDIRIDRPTPTTIEYVVRLVDEQAMVPDGKSSDNVFYYMEQHPDVITGNHDSDMSHALKPLMFLDYITERAVVAEYHRTMPSVIVQPRANTMANADKMQLDRGEFTVFEDVSEQYYEVDALQNESLERNMEWSEKQRESAARRPGPGFYDPQTRNVVKFDASFEANMRRLGGGMEVAGNVPKAEPRTDLTNVYNTFMTLVCGIFGIPKTMIFNESSARSNNSAIDSVKLDESAKNLRLRVEKMLQYVYFEIYGDTDMNIRLNFAPEISLDQLHELYKCGVINDHVFANLMAARSGLSPELINTKIDVKKSIELYTQAMAGGRQEQTPGGPNTKKRSSEDKMLMDPSTQKKSRDGGGSSGE